MHLWGMVQGLRVQCLMFGMVPVSCKSASL